MKKSVVSFILKKSVEPWFIAQALASRAHLKNTQFTEWVSLRFFKGTLKTIACILIPLSTDFSRFN